MIRDWGVDQYMAVAEMPDKAVFVGQWLAPGSTATALIRLTDMSRSVVATLGVERLEEVLGDFAAVTCPATVEGIIALHPSGYAAAVNGEEVQLWRYDAGMWSLAAVGAIYANPEEHNFELIVQAGEVYLVQWTADQTTCLGAGKVLVQRGEALVPLADSNVPAIIKERAAFDWAAARWRGQWVGLTGHPGRVTRHDGQQQVLLAITDDLRGAEAAAADRHGVHMFPWGWWGYWRGADGGLYGDWEAVEIGGGAFTRGGVGQPATEPWGMDIVAASAGAGQRLWLLGYDQLADVVTHPGMPLDADYQVRRLYLLRQAAAQGVGLDQVELWAADRTSGTHAQRPRLAEVQLRALPPARSRPALAETQLWAADRTQGTHDNRPRLAQTELWASDLSQGTHEERPRIAEMILGAARAASQGPRLEEMLLGAIGQNYMPTGTHIRFVLEEGLDGEIAHEVRVGVGLSRADIEQLRAIVRVDREDIEADDLNTYEEIPIGVGVELPQPGTTVRVGIIKPTTMPEIDVRVQTRRFEE